LWISAPGLVIDSTSAASPATLRAMSAITVKVVTTLNLAAAVDGSVARPIVNATAAAAKNLLTEIKTNSIALLNAATLAEAKDYCN
jgi:hypothetical protein